MSNNRSKLINKQTGLVSVTVTIVIMIIVTLVVSSFALIVRREQRRALNRQLNTQAFAAAEAGINDAYSAINDANNPLTEDIKDCTGANSFIDKVNSTGGFAYKSNIEDADNIKYSCVLINQNTLDSYDKQAKVVDGAFLVPVHTDENISSLRLSWQGDGATGDKYTQMPDDYKLPQSLEAPMLKVVLFKGFPPNTASSLATPISRDDLKSSAHTMFLTPNDNDPNNAGGINYSESNNQTLNTQGQFVSGQCNNANIGTEVAGKRFEYSCNIDINHLSGSKDYYLAVKPLYKDVRFNLRAYDSGGSSLYQRGSQVEIDATGKAADILQRIRVRLPMGDNTNNIIPDAVISTTDSICKMWEVGSSVDDNCNSSITPPPGGGGGGGGSGIGQDKCNIPPINPDCKKDEVWEGWPLTNESDPLRLERWVSVTYDNPVGIIDHCVWDWGDGSTTALPANQCTIGSSTSHKYNPANDFPGRDWLTECTQYHILLTIMFNNGYASQTSDDWLAVPIKSSTVGHRNPCD